MFFRYSHIQDMEGAPYVTAGAADLHICAIPSPSGVADPAVFFRLDPDL